MGEAAATNYTLYPENSRHNPLSLWERVRVRAR